MIFYTFYTFCIIILFYINTSLSLCIQNHEYIKHKKCVPCTKCSPPLIVVATCTQFRDTYCGRPAFANQSDSPFDKEIWGNEYPQRTSKSTHFKDVKKESKPFKRKKFKCDYLKKGNKRDKCKRMRLNRKLVPRPEIPASENMLHSEVQLRNDKEDNDFPAYPNLLTNVTKTNTPINKKDESFWTKYEVKLSIIISIIVFDTILIFVLVVLFCKNCTTNVNKTGNRENGQRLPNPSNVPVKCRFTAVHPSNSPQCLNDSPASTLLRSNRNHHDSGSMSQYSVTCPRPDYHQTDFIHNYPDSSLSLPRSNPHSTFQPRETASHYALPPNSYVMDRLLAENRNGDGHLPMENNVYVESWCNASSPLPPDGCDNAVPFFAGFQAPTNYSSASSPIMLRTYRET